MNILPSDMTWNILWKLQKIIYLVCDDTCSSSIFGCIQGLAPEPVSIPGSFSSSPAPTASACVSRLSECPAELD